MVFESVDNIKKEYWERLSDEEKKRIRISEEREKNNEENENVDNNINKNINKNSRTL